jgi:hypothetical protein
MFAPLRFNQSELAFWDLNRSDRKLASLVSRVYCVCVWFFSEWQWACVSHLTARTCQSSRARRSVGNWQASRSPRQCIQYSTFSTSVAPLVGTLALLTTTNYYILLNFNCCIEQTVTSPNQLTPNVSNSTSSCLSTALTFSSSMSVATQHLQAKSWLKK